MCKPFLYFYSAISNEFLGRAAHLYSHSKVPLLNQALNSFLECGSALPQPMKLPKSSFLPDSVDFDAFLTPPETPGHSTQYTAEDFLIWVDTPEGASPERPALIRSMTQLIDLSLSNADDDPFVSDSGSDRTSSFTLTLPKLRASPRRVIDRENRTLSPHKTLRSPNSPKKLRLTPSPLRIKKSGRTKQSAVTYNDESSTDVEHSPRSKPMPLQMTSASKTNSMAKKSSTMNSASMLTINGYSPPCKSTTPSSVYSRGSDGIMEVTANITPACAAKIVRFNRGIEFLREQISTNVIEVQKHVDQVKDVQHARRARQMKRASSFWNFHPITDQVLEKDIEKEEVLQEQKKPEPEPFIDEFGNILYKETRLERRARLRTDGWSTVGLRSNSSTWKGGRYYQEFCNLVLTELALDK
jgi:hypothetical protein